MVEQQPRHNLSPQLCAVLGSLNVSLEDELNRYRRNRRLDGIAEEDLFADLDEAVFGSDFSDSIFESSIVPIPAAMPAIAPPPVPQNKRLLQARSENPQRSPERQTQFADDSEERGEQSTDYDTDYGQLVSQRYGALVQHTSNPSEALALSGTEDPQLDVVTSGSIVRHTTAAVDEETLDDTEKLLTPTGYLESSEKLIESLEEVPSLPDPVELNRKPKKKTVSILAGASLGLVGLVAGLGASYLMANPAVTQKIVSNFQRPEPQVATNQPAKSFDPPGPDLSANEFIDLELDNLSSLKMPSTGVNTNLATGNISAPSENATLPPIDQTTALPTAPIAPPQASTPATTPNTAPAIETQAVVVPVGLTYYVTAPFNTDQDLTNIRESVSEAFVRQFVSGNKIQIAAFDNPETAQQFVEELAQQNITAQIYGPTAE